MEPQKLTREEWQASESARKKLDQLEKRRQAAVTTAVQGRHKYYDKLREALLSSLPEPLQSQFRAEMAATEEVTELSDEDAPEVSEEAAE